MCSRYRPLGDRARGGGRVERGTAIIDEEGVRPAAASEEVPVNLAYVVVAAVEFVAVEMADLPSEKDRPTPDEVMAGLDRIAEEPRTILPTSSA